ncbi:MAG: GNAT family N-acetyltransferase [Ponticaulis sp.]|nr:GNAT family N-acetyltransferase [Ponticaulis sp.]|tara:strand:+ start:753 stop:1193 length:441 start_codon:yes stop_codon:yes gene_type:complete
MIRPYNPVDTDALVTIWRDATALAHPFLNDDFVSSEADNLRNIYLPNADTWVLAANNRLLGFISMIGDEIGGLFLDPERHGRGFGRALVDHVAATRDELTVEVFEQNAIGRRFYDRYGFVELSRYHHEPSGQLTIRMACNPMLRTG